MQDIQKLTIQEIDILIKHCGALYENYKSAEEDYDVDNMLGSKKKYNKLCSLYGQMELILKGEMERRIFTLTKGIDVSNEEGFNPYFNEEEYLLGLFK